jgi:hypothetical protein
VTPDPWTGSNIESGDIVFKGVPLTAGINFRLFIVVKTYTNLRAFSLKSRAGVCYVKMVDCQTKCSHSHPTKT